MARFELPRKVWSYCLRLHAHYSNTGESELRDIIGNSRAYVVEETTYDNWDGGTYGHDVQLFLSMEELFRVDINDVEKLTRRICEDLNKVSKGVPNEFFENVHLELFDDGDENCLRAKPLYSKPAIDADTLSIWKKGMVRLFISHRDEHKAKANELAEALEHYGISSFVAHDSIQPMEIWQSEIVKGLETMEIMLAFVTNDLHSSVWTNQEIGFALGRKIPIVSLKLQSQDPRGFIGKQQALKCRYNDVGAATPKIYKVLADKLGNRERLQTSLISAFLSSPSFDEAKRRFDCMKNVVDSLSEAEVAEITEGFRRNDQLHNAIYLNNKNCRLRKFLNKVSGKEFIIEGKNIRVEGKELEDIVPF
ncbi:MAG: toll/interleukin-1 receptor domain-containing protein [Albidovulum sp.]|nr:toll/interleukin-1 receptor domain-containing protein [Albidovulum sp.]